MDDELDSQDWKNYFNVQGIVFGFFRDITKPFDGPSGRDTVHMRLKRFYDTVEIIEGGIVHAKDLKLEFNYSSVRLERSRDVFVKHIGDIQSGIASDFSINAMKSRAGLTWPILIMIGKNVSSDAKIFCHNNGIYLVYWDGEKYKEQGWRCIKLDQDQTLLTNYKNNNGGIQDEKH